MAADAEPAPTGCVLENEGAFATPGAMPPAAPPDAPPPGPSIPLRMLDVPLSLRNPRAKIKVFLKSLGPERPAAMASFNRLDCETYLGPGRNRTRTGHVEGGSVLQRLPLVDTGPIAPSTAGRASGELPYARL